MSVIEIEELYTRNAQSNAKGHRTYTRVFLVETDDPQDDSIVVTEALEDLGLIKGTSYSTDTTSDAAALLTDTVASCVHENGMAWECTYTWTTDAENVTSPLDEPADVQWDFSPYPKPVEYDITGQPILNSAGDPYSQPLEIDAHRPILKIQRNEAAFNAALAYQYSGAVNGTFFYGCPPGTVKVSGISSRRILDPVWGYYWVTSYEFQFNIEGFDRVLLDQGMREIDSSTGKLKPILAQGVPVSEPHLLNGQGRKLPEGGQPQFRTFRVYPRLPFNLFVF